MSETVAKKSAWTQLRLGWQAWVELLARKEAATALALVRIGVGAVTLHTMTAIYFMDVMEPLWANKDEGGIVDLANKNWLVEQLGGASLDTSHTLLWTCAAACVLLILGLGSRVAALVALLTSIALFSLHPGSGGGHDRLMTNMLWLLVFARSDATLSLWCFIRNRQWTSTEQVYGWVRLALIFQVAVMYWATGIQKMGIEWMPWGGYEAIYYAVLHPAFAHFDHSWVANMMPLVRMGTAITWIWEVSFPIVVLWLWCRHTRERGGRLRRWLLRWDLRLLYAGIGLSMHGIIWFLMDVGPFSTITVCFYFCLFHPDEYAQLWKRIQSARTDEATSLQKETGT
jgi:hypothetical protein